MKIVELIPHGANNAISRQKLAELAEQNGIIAHNIKFKDRCTRKLIEDARADGEPICSLPTGGYFIPTLDDQEALRVFVATEMSRALKVYKNVKACENLLEDMRHHRFNHDDIDSHPIQA